MLFLPSNRSDASGAWHTYRLGFGAPGDMIEIRGQAALVYGASNQLHFAR